MRLSSWFEAKIHKAHFLGSKRLVEIMTMLYVKPMHFFLEPLLASAKRLGFYPNNSVSTVSSFVSRINLFTIIVFLVYGHDLYITSADCVTKFSKRQRVLPVLCISPKTGQKAIDEQFLPCIQRHF